MSAACYFLNDEQFRIVSDKRMALARSRPEGRQWASMHEVTPPGAMWYVPWFYDPADPEDAGQRAHALAAIASNTLKSYLSRMYWQQWSDKRPPICVLCPNGAEWVVDAKSSNGEGWTVTGDVPLISCTPSIAVTGYHGHLGTSGASPGWFTGDVEGRGPMGLPPKPYE